MRHERNQARKNRDRREAERLVRDQRNGDGEWQERLREGRNRGGGAEPRQGEGKGGIAVPPLPSEYT